MGPFARLAGTSARLALGQLVLLGVALEALPNDRSGARISKNSASVPAIGRQIGSVRTDAGLFPQPSHGGGCRHWTGRARSPKQPGDSTDGLHYLTAI